jgi:hypothetical protein
MEVAYWFIKMAHGIRASLCVIRNRGSASFSMRMVAFTMETGVMMNKPVKEL